MTKAQINKAAKNATPMIRAASDRKAATWDAFKKTFGDDWYSQLEQAAFFYNVVERHLVMIGDIPGNGNKSRRRAKLPVFVYAPERFAKYRK
jgi:hypothetical protein